MQVVPPYPRGDWSYIYTFTFFPRNPVPVVSVELVSLVSLVNKVSKVPMESADGRGSYLADFLPTANWQLEIEFNIR